MIGCPGFTGFNGWIGFHGLIGCPGLIRFQGLIGGTGLILGGLIDKVQNTENKGVPILSEIPVLGYLFKHKLKSEETRELVIILSVKLI